MMKDLAVLFPCFNGGRRLRESVESCAAAGLPADKYALIVVDNCSTDGSVEALPAVDGNNVPIQIYRNERNLGRVANWNRALEIAGGAGFRFATFLFAGDTWTPGTSIEALLTMMQQSNAVLGMAPIRIVEEDGYPRPRDGARISIPGTSALTDAGSFLEYIIRVGRLPFAPIQANIYRLFAENPLCFDTDPKSALNTDIEATVAWLRHHPGKIALVSTPFLVWKGHSGRFLSRQDPWFVMLETRASLQRVSDMTSLSVDWESANAISLLMSFRELSSGGNLRDRLRFLIRVVRYLRSAPGGLRIGQVLRFTYNKVLRKQSYLSLTRDSELLLDRDSRQQSGAPAVLTRMGL
jgi:glycosyltransferase involved in cell wall biosynthesis